MKLIVTHNCPDIDAVASCWLIRKFLPGWKSAEIKFVPAGSTYKNTGVDSDHDIIHTDTGFGKFDHHQTNDYTCATKKIFEYLIDKKLIKQKFVEPLERLINIVNEDDHFYDIYYPDPASDIYDITLQKLIEGVNNYIGSEEKTIETGLFLMDIAFNNFCAKVSAEKTIKESYIFKSYWGKTIAIESNNRYCSKTAQRMGHTLVIQKYKNSGYVKIKTRPDCKKQLKKLYDILIEKDKKATWYYHRCGHMILNGTFKNPNFKSSHLTIAQLINIVKTII